MEVGAVVEGKGMETSLLMIAVIWVIGVTVMHLPLDRKGYFLNSILLRSLVDGV